MHCHLVSYAISPSTHAEGPSRIYRLMPIAMIPRPWDFPDPPKTLQPGLNAQAASPPASAPANAPPSKGAPASPASPLPVTQSPAPADLTPVPSPA